MRLCIALVAFAGMAFAEDNAAPSWPGNMVGHMKGVRESSGIAASRAHPGVFWTHGDSGSDPKLYAVHRDGTVLGQCVIDAKNRDWEDIAIDEHGHLYIGDTGNNGRGKRTVMVYRIDEPDPATLGARDPAQPVPLAGTWELNYPAQPFDCESLFVFGEWGYVISKNTDGTPATIYRFSLAPQAEPASLEPVTQLEVSMPVTGADIAPDGTRLVLVTPTGVNVFELSNGEVASAGNVEPMRAWFINLGMEACCFVSDGVLATAESGDIFFFPNERLHKRTPTAVPAEGRR